jgi:hypothetical protein
MFLVIVIFISTPTQLFSSCTSPQFTYLAENRQEPPCKRPHDDDEQEEEYPTDQDIFGVCSFIRS